MPKKIVDASDDVGSTPNPLHELDEGRVIFKPEQTQTQSVSESPIHNPVSRDTRITKVNARYSPRGRYGQKYLAAGVKISMRLWDEEQPGKPKAQTQRDYETVGYVVQGRAELQLEGQTIVLEPGDSWIVPKGSVHRYTILEPFTAIEATCPPAEVHGRDEE
jgi:quercetin dioxygenase-like cupin family protein